MFCHRCGEELPGDARFCMKCGAAVTRLTEKSSGETSGKPTKHEPFPEVTVKEKIPIWNPNAAANWSIIFTPAFGSYIHALNWRTIGRQEDRARSAMGWFYFSLAMLAVYIGIFIAGLKAAEGLVILLSLLYLGLWYFANGRTQVAYVQEKFGNKYGYHRRPWGKPLLIAVAAVVGYWIMCVVIGSIIGAARMT